MKKKLHLNLRNLSVFEQQESFTFSKKVMGLFLFVGLFGFNQNAEAQITSVTPYIQSVSGGVTTKSILTVTENIGGYKMVGIPDGLGAFDNNDGTFTLLMNHELGNTLGVTRAHGAIGAFVSKWVINKSNLNVVSGSDLITSVYGWNATTQSSDALTTAVAFNRFCSADLPAVNAFYNPSSGLGTQSRIYMNGEEGSATGYAVASVASGANIGKSYILGKFNLTTNASGLTAVGAWENLLANYYPQDKTVVIGNNDGGTGIMNGSVAVYVGTKTNTGSEADKAGLTNGTLKFVNVTGNALEIPTANATTRATNITNGTAFTLSATASTFFSRPEDGAWDPNDPTKYYFVTTDRLDQVADGIGTQVGRSRLWRLNFTNITNPDLGGTIDMLLDGTEGQVMMDNMTIDKYGHIILLEDVGGNTHNGKIWQYTIATDQIKLLAKHDPARFGDIVGGVAQAATAPFSNDEETSGIIDMSDILGAGNFLLVDQAHYSVGDTEAVEGGQLLKLYNPDTYNSSLNTSPYVLPVASGVTTKSILTVTENIGGYKMVGIPDGLGAFDNNNGTFTLLMNHELGNTLGITRAHGAIGAFVSKWVINKSNLNVVSGSDLITSVYGWNTATQNSDASTTAVAFNRFCSADLPAVNAFYNPSSGLGTQSRIYMNGEEGSTTGYAVASVASGANIGKAYILGKFNLTTNGSGLTAVGAWENLLANYYPQDKTVVIGNNDGGTGIMNGSIAVYVGTKTNTGTEADKAGLTNGTVKFVNVTGNTVEIANSTTRATNITNGTAFTLSATASTFFSRPEDGAWDPNDPTKYYFVTTDRLDQVADGIGTQVGRSRLWRLNFANITNPDLGGTIDMLLDGTEGQVMMDNMTIDKYGHIILLEDVGGNAHNGKIWQYTIATDQIKLLAKHDPARFGDIVGGVAQAATAPFSNDEETSGIIDMSDILGAGNFLLVDQAHYNVGDTEAVEGGQLLRLYNPDTYTSSLYTTDFLQNVSTFEVIAYPNPYSSEFQVSLSSKENNPVELKVYDLNGKLLETRKFDTFKLEDEKIGNNYKSGVYIVVVTQGENKKTLRVIKK